MVQIQVDYALRYNGYRGKRCSIFLCPCPCTSVNARANNHGCRRRMHRAYTAEMQGCQGLSSVSGWLAYIVHMLGLVRGHHT